MFFQQPPKVQGPQMRQSRIAGFLFIVVTQLIGCGGGETTQTSNDVGPPVTTELQFLVSFSQSPLPADSVTTLVLTPVDARGQLWPAPVPAPRISSQCAGQNLATLGGSPIADGPQWLQSYSANGCQGNDRLTLFYTDQGRQVQQQVTLPLLPPQLSKLAQLGKILFFSADLAANAQTCADCHHPAFGYSPAESAPTQQGGINRAVAGFRRSPALGYQGFTPAFSWSALALPLASSSARGTPVGGQFADGRAADLTAQVAGPLFSKHEMANADAAQLMQRILQQPSGSAFLQQFPTPTDATVLVQQVSQAIAAFEQQDTSFRLFNSKFDAVGQGQAQFSAAESRGYAIFRDPQRGNCMACHSSTLTQPGQPELFTNHSYVRHAVPRNWQIPYNEDTKTDSALATAGQSGWAYQGDNAEHRFYDLGICGPMRNTAAIAEHCGAFRVPGLRNVAIRQAYFHNGVYRQLSQVLDFYRWRDVQPARIYRTATNQPDVAYHDLPALWRQPLQHAPFSPQANGSDRLSDNDIADLIQFLCTLTDGFDPSNPRGYRLPAQCR